MTASAIALPEGFLQGIVVAAALAEPLSSLIRQRSAPIEPVGEESVSGAEPERTEAATRILVAISKPSTAAALMELSFAFRFRGSTVPVFPLAVISEARESESGFSRAEDMLAEALVQGLSSSVPLVPVTRMAMNVSTGILQAAYEQRADAIVVGWYQPPRLEHAFFGSVIERVIAGGRALTIVARLPEARAGSGTAGSRSFLQGLRHLCIIAPPTSETHPGFRSTMNSLRILASNLQTRVTLATLGAHARELLEAAEEAGFSGAQALEAPDWRSLADALDRVGSHNARIFALISARPGERSWHPAVERLPHLLGERFSDAPLIMAYFPSSGIGPETVSGSGAGPDSAAKAPAPVPADRAAELLSDAVHSGRICLNMPERAVADGIRQMLAAAFPHDRRNVAALGSTFTGIAQRTPIELSPGVVLLHARTHVTEREIVCFGSHSEGYRLSALDAPARVLVLVCVPESASPEVHLATLGDIARLMTERRLAHRLLEAKDAAELLDGAPGPLTGS